MAGLMQGAAYVAPVLAALGGDTLLTRNALRGASEVNVEEVNIKADALGENLIWGDEEVGSIRTAYDAGWLDWQGRLQAAGTGVDFFGENWAAMREFTADFDVWHQIADELGVTYDELMAITPSDSKFAEIDRKIKGMTKYTQSVFDNIDYMDMDDDVIPWAPQTQNTIFGNMRNMMAQYIEKDTERINAQYEQAGLDGASGFADGIDEGASDAAASGTNMAEETISAVEQALDEHSPSKVMAAIGMNAAFGFAQGIDEGAKAAISSAEAMASAVSSIVASAMAALSNAVAMTSRSVGGLGGSASGGIYDGSTTVNIGTYTQSSTGDMYALADAVAAAQKKGRQGFGRRG